MAYYVEVSEQQTPGNVAGTQEGSIQKSRWPIGQAAKHDEPQFTGIETGITASGTTSQADSYGLTKAVNVIGTAAANSGVRLPVGEAGAIMVIRNSGASTANIYPSTGGTINGGSADAAITLATTKTVIMVAAAANTWFSFPGA